MVQTIDRLNKRSRQKSDIPRAKLTIDAEDGNVVIAGTVPDRREYDTIEPLAKEILGVKAVTMNVEVVPPNNN